MDPEESDKMKREWAKIRKLENKLGAANKAQQHMQGKINDQKMRLEAALNKAQGLEEEKKQVTSQYDLKNKRGLTSQNQSNTAKKPPVQSGKAIFKSNAQKAAEAEAKMFGGGGGDDNTFLTDLMMGKK